MNKYIEKAKISTSSELITFFNASIEENKASPLELYLISEAMTMVGCFDEALMVYKKILKLHPAWGDILELSARACWATHRYEQAIKFWKSYISYREQVYDDIKLDSGTFTIDEVFTESYGNYAFLFPILSNGYLKKSDTFFYHDNVVKFLSENKHQKSKEKGLLSNSLMFEGYQEKIKSTLPSGLSKILTINNQITRLPFYCGIDSKRQPTHFQNAWCENLINMTKNGEDLNFASEQFSNPKLLSQFQNLNLDPERPLVCVHVRESGYWARKGNLTHSTKNADIHTYIPAIDFLIASGFQVVRLGDATMKKLPKRKYLFDYAHSNKKTSNLDVLLMKKAKFMICTCSGPFQVAGILQTPLLATNWIPVHILPYSKRDMVLLKKLKRTDSSKGSILEFSEMLSLDFAEFSFYNLARQGLEVVDNTEEELLEATKLFVRRLSLDLDANPKSEHLYPSFLGSMFKMKTKRRKIFNGINIVSNCKVIDPITNALFED